MTSTPRMPLRKRILFSSLLVVLVAVAIEILAFITYRVAMDEWFSPARVKAARQSVLASVDTSGTQAANPLRSFEAEAIHPYVGFTLDPTDPRLSGRIGSQGFTVDPLIPRRPGELRVALFGGSMAWLTAAAIENALKPLVTVPPYDWKEVRFFNLALGGAKQPQQLMALAFFLSLGADFDVVINLDGFNDIVLPVAENFAEGVAPVYPRGWSARVGELSDSRSLAAAGRVVSSREARKRWAGIVDRSHLGFSPFVGTVWAVVDRVLQSRAADAETEVRSRLMGDRSYARTGPPPPATIPEVRQQMADVWFRSSVQMHDLTRRSDALYFHFLQPNQYVTGSKVLTSDERRIAFKPESPYGSNAAGGYPLLISAGARFAEAGVPYEDLTRLFVDDGRTLYVDDCCHLNPVGTDALASHIARRVASALRGR
jgi:hypothetical protein